MRSTGFLVVVLLNACAWGPDYPADPDGGMPGRPDAGPGPGDDAAIPDMDGGGGVDAGEIDIRYPARSCDVTLRYAASPGTGEVRLAGDFTDWDRGALPMADPEGDGIFEITLSPGGRLGSGEVHAYKLIVDGTWMLDNAAGLRRYDGMCLNSGIRMPDCERPEATASPVVTTFDAASGTGSARVEIAIATAADGAAPTDLAFVLDDGPLPDGTATAREDGSWEIALAGLAAGRHLLRVRLSDTMGRDALPIDLPFWIEEERFEWRDATMYMIVVDRFANGDRGNDSPEGAPVEYPADWHGGDLQGVLQVMESGYFERLGVRSIWLSPLNVQADNHWEGRESPRQFTGYHGYWPVRAREVEPRFGGNDALRALVDEAHRRGIRILLDLINNQVHEAHEYYTAHPDWFRTGCVCGIDPGCGWSERPLDCLFARYLPDINWRNVDAETQLVDDAAWWVSEMGIDGFRIDAVKHVETSSIFNLRAELTRRFEQGGNRLGLFGETAVGEWDSVDYGCGESYGSGYQWIDGYVGPNALDGQFDFPTHHRMQWGLVTDAMPYNDVETIVRDAETRYRPDGLHVRFLGTHDSNRMASRASLDPARDCRWPDEGGCSSLPRDPTDPAVFGRLERAFTVLYTLPGIPFLYYGDEVAMAGGNDPDNRRDMLWSGELAPVAMGGTTLRTEQTELTARLAALGQARTRSAALRRGRRVPLIVERDLYVYGYVADGGERAVVAVNRGARVSGRPVDGFVLGGVTDFETAVGTGSLTATGDRLSLTLDPGEAAVFLSR